jgi:hypothetical protein
MNDSLMCLHALECASPRVPTSADEIPVAVYDARFTDSGH